MTHPVAINIYSTQIVVLKYHFLLKIKTTKTNKQKKIEFVGETVGSRSGIGDIKDQPGHHVLSDSKGMIKDLS